MSLLAAIAAGWIVGLITGAFVHPSPLAGALALVALGLGTAAVGADRMRGARGGRAWVFALAAGAALAGVPAGHAPPVAPVPPPGLARLVGTVEHVRHDPWGASAVLRVEQGRRVSDGAAIAPGLRVRLRGAALPAGARLRVLARLTPRPAFRNPTPHPPWPVARPVRATGHVPEGARPRILARHRLTDVIEAARARVRRALDSTLSPRARGLARALLLGESRAVDTDDRAAVRGAGLAHVLAVSGLHVVLLAGLVAALIRRLLLVVPALAVRTDPRRVAAALAIPFALAHAALAGAAPSAVRAAVTASIAWALVAFGRRPKAVPVAAAAAILLGLSAPAEAARPSLLLSVVATAALVTAKLDHGPGALGALRSAFTVSARATIATAPIVLYCFGALPLLGVLANVLLVPVGALLLLPLAAVHALVALTVRPLAVLTAAPLEGVAAAFVGGCRLFADIPLGHDLPPPSVVQGLALAVASMGWLVARQVRTRLAVVAVAALVVAGGEVALRHAEKPRGVVRLTQLDVGQGDGALIDMPDGRLMMVDAGGAGFGGVDPGARAIVPLLRARRRSRVDVFVLSHPHPDHYGGLVAVADAVPIGEVWDSGQATAETPDSVPARLLAHLRHRGVRVLGPSALCGHPRRFGVARVRLLSPCPRFDPGFEANDNSMVLRIEIGHRALLMTGDVEALAESSLLHRHLPLRADVLKVPHHGSRTSSTAPFLAAVRPRLALISAGRENRFGHPHAAALARLTRAGTTVLRTDRQGGIVVTTDGRALSARTWTGTTVQVPP